MSAGGEPVGGPSAGGGPPGPGPPGGPPSPESRSRQRWTLLVVCVASFMLLLDTTIVAVALPAISTHLHTSFSELQWVVDAYALLLAVALLSAGSLSDIIGRRHVFLVGLVIFTAASAVCGAAWTPLVLDVARAVQGLGGALMLAPALALLAQEFPPAERGNAFGTWGAVTAVAIATGPLAGGVLTDAFGWRSIFYVNLPIGLVVIYVTVKKLVNLPGPPTSIDWFGLMTFSSASFALVFALVRGNDEGWSSTIILSLLIASGVLLLLFLLVEMRVSAPMLDLTLFRNPACTGASIVAFAVSGSALALVIYITLWYESIRGYSPLQAGLRLLPITALGLVLKPLAGRAWEKVPPGLLLGMGLAFVGAGLLAMSSVGATSHWTVLLPGLFLCGIGLGVLGPPLAAVSVGVVTPQKSGMASGVNTTFRQLGLVTGIAALGAVFQHQVRTHVAELLTGTPGAPVIKPFGNAVAAGGTQGFIKHSPANGRGPLFHAAEVSFSAGFHDILLIGGAAALVGGVLGPILVRRRHLVGAGPPAAGVGAPAAPVVPFRDRVSLAAAEGGVILIALGFAVAAGFVGWVIGHHGAHSTRTVTVAARTSATTTSGTTPAGGGNAVAGKAVFQSAGCSTCHTLKAAGATGTVGPNLDQKKPSAALVLDRVAHGKGAMPAFDKQLSAQQIDDVATFVAQSTSAATTTGAAPASSGGSATAGKSVFQSAGCSSCHTLKAAGATGTVGPNLDEKKPSLALVVDFVTHGKGGMPSFATQLSAQQIKDVAAYVVQSTSGG